MKEATTSLAQCVRIKRGLFFVPHAAIFAVVRRSGAEVSSNLPTVPLSTRADSP